MITIKTIAEHLNLSKGTVSMALRNHPSVAEKTKQQVRQAAEELGYVPNPSVAHLMSHLKKGKGAPSHETIAYITNFSQKLKWKTWRTMRLNFEGAKQRAHSLGYQLDHYWLKEPNLTPKRFSQILKARSIRGIILAPLEEDYGTLDLLWDDFCSIALGYNIVSPNLDRVSSDLQHSINTILTQLSERNYTRIALVLNEKQYRRGAHHFAAATYFGFLHSHPSLDIMQPKINKTFDAESLIRWAKKEKSDAIIGEHSYLEKVYNSLLPQMPKLAAAAYNIQAKLKSKIKMSGINNLPDQVGAIAVDQLIAKINANQHGISEHATKVLVEGVWVEGQTIPSKKK